MKKLALLLALCLFVSSIGLTAFAEEQAVEIVATEENIPKCFSISSVVAPQS